jgi:predicted ATP-grasp superfamily ATP-dependent carboligase
VHVGENNNLLNNKNRRTQDSSSSTTIIIITMSKFFKPRVMKNTNTYGKIEVREFENVDSCDGAVLIEAYPNPASESMISAIIASNYLVQQLGLPMVGEITCPLFYPMAVIRKGEAARGARIYGNASVVVFISEYQLKDADLQQDMVTAIYDFAMRHHCSVIVTMDVTADDPTSLSPLLNLELQTDDNIIGEEVCEEQNAHITSGTDAEPLIGIRTRRRNSTSTLLEDLKHNKLHNEVESKVWYLTNNEEYGEMLSLLGYEPIIETVAKGIPGGIISSAMTNTQPVILILASLDSLKLGTTPAVALIKYLNKMLMYCANKSTKGVTLPVKDLIDPEELSRSTKDLEEKISQFLLRGDKVDAYSAMYM